MTSALPITLIGALLFGLGPGAATQEPSPSPSPGTVDTLRAIGGLPPHICNAFRQPLGFQQTAAGTYYVFDRRGHSVHRVEADLSASHMIVEIGDEAGRVLEPTAFDAAPDGMFAVADSPNGRERLQIFDPSGRPVGGFTLPGRAITRLGLGSLALGGVSTLAFLGRGIALNQPEAGTLITEYGFAGTPVRSIGVLRATGHERDLQLHLAMNSGIPLPHPAGGYYFVFYAGVPVFRRYDARGGLLFERVMQGRELDPVLAAAPQAWPIRSVDGKEVPLVVPTVRTAAVDRAGKLWVSFVTPYTYVFDSDGDKVRTVQFRAAGAVSPSSLFFASNGEVLITPGCYAFTTR